MEYLEALDRWANESLGIQWSSQVGYNMAVDMVCLTTSALFGR